ncbi:response regulator [Terriglobus sp.]|uniref:response regulator n=1 Tax=Terriglobus sp. TaxID=1889013 RepID=UPI003B00C899
MPIRPCFLVIDSEHASSISTRKLVLETAKYNVMTAYSCEEADVLLQKFSKVSAVVINGITLDGRAVPLLQTLRDLPEVKLVVVGDGFTPEDTRQPDVMVKSFAPPKLLKALQRLFPAETRELLDHEEELERENP